MATLSKHGQEIGRIKGLTWTKAYFANGDILKDSGFGWKVWGKVKAGMNPEDVFKRHQEHVESVLTARPAYATYKRELHELAPLSLRWKLHTAVEANPQDPDGVWSDCADGYGDNVHASIEEIVNLTRLYLLEEGERKELAALGTK